MAYALAIDCNILRPLCLRLHILKLMSVYQTVYLYAIEQVTLQFGANI